MKTLLEFLVKQHVKNTKHDYHPKDKDELIKFIKEEIGKQGVGANLNCIDTSNITDMSRLFSDKNGTEFNNFNGDISKWDVSNVKTMSSMFWKSKFEGDISKWNVSKVKDMYSMFFASKFDGDLSQWDVSNVDRMEAMFYKSKFTGNNGDISNWDVYNVRDANSMFSGTKFCHDLSKWIFKSEIHSKTFFEDCPMQKKRKFWPRNFFNEY